MLLGKVSTCLLDDLCLETAAGAQSSDLEDARAPHNRHLLHLGLRERACNNVAEESEDQGADTWRLSPVPLRPYL